MFTVRPINYALTRLWGVYNPEGYFCGSYFEQERADAFAASRNAAVAAQ